MSTATSAPTTSGLDFKVADLSLAEFGRKEIRLAEHEMPGLMALRREYGAAELQRLRTLRELLAEKDLGLSDLGFALRLRRDRDLRDAVEAWFEAEPARPEEIPAPDWLRWEQEKHQRLIATINTEKTPA